METIWSKTAGVLNEHGWVKDSYGDSRKGFCLVGGLVVALGYGVWVNKGVFEPRIGHNHVTDPRYRVAYTTLAEALNLEDNWYGRAVQVWNDDDSTTRQDVLGLLRALHEKELAERGELA